MLKQLCVATTACLLLGQSARAQGDLQITGKAEIMIDFISGKGITDTAEDVDLDLFLSKDLAENVAIKVKLDVEDSATDGDLIEEAYMLFKRIGGSPVDIAVGRKEIAAGQDRMLWESFPLAHKDESDNRWALETAIAAGELATIWVTAFQDEAGTWDSDGDLVNDGPKDSFQSYALKAQFRIDDFKVNLSYLNAHDGSQTGAGLARDEGEFVVGVEYGNKALGLSAFVEYLGVTNWDHANADDGSVLQGGVIFAFGPDKQVEVGVIYEVQQSSNAGGDTRDDAMLITGVGWKVTPKTTLFGEYTSEHDAVHDTDVSTTTFGVMAKF